MKFLSINILSILTLFFVILFWQRPVILTIILFIIGFLMIYILKDKKMVLVFLSCGVMGSITEIIAIYYGVWYYSKINFINIPSWLIPLWGIAALFIINFSKQIEYYLIRLKSFKKIKK